MKQQKQLQVYGRVRAYLFDHARNLIFSLGRLYRTPFSSLMTMAVLGFALALPSGLYVILKNLQAVTESWESAAQISLFLRPGTTVEHMHATAKRLRNHTDIVRVETLGADQALTEFRSTSGFGEALDVLNENPLPHVIVLTPRFDPQQAILVEKLRVELGGWPEVDIAQLDMQWLQRLHAIMDIARKVIVTVAIILATSVLLIVGNTIRLDIQNRHHEIEVTRMVGATDGFIRRPFLYGGFWYGTIGGLLAWLIVFIVLVVVEGPAHRLASLYSSQYQVLGLGGFDSIAMLTASASLGLAGSWLAVGRHLNEIEPH